MTEPNPETSQAIQGIIDHRILDVRLPEYHYTQEHPRICLFQILNTTGSNSQVEAKRQDIERALLRDPEDYDEAEHGAIPKDVDPEADILVCGIGGCTLRIFKDEDDKDIQVGTCKATDYCLRDKFKEVGATATVEEGRELYSDIIDTCDGRVGRAGAGNFCPQLNCNLSAGVSVGQVPGTSGTCPKRNGIPLNTEQ